jgi:predicted metal-dependent hydrolase
MIAIDRIIRTRRRTLALIVEHDGKLIVRAPMRAKEDAIHEFVKDKEKWILTKQEQARARYVDFVPKEFVSGEEFLYLGNHYRLEVVSTKKPALALDRGFRLAHAAVPRAAAVFERWYRARAFQVISERVEWHAAKHGFDYRQVKITAARRSGVRAELRATSASHGDWSWLPCTS